MKLFVTIVFMALLVLELINIFSYQYFRAQVKGRARFEVLRPADSTGVMHYLCPGLLERARPSFNFAFARLRGGITIIDYVNTGVKPKAVAQQILNDIKAHGYHGVVITISYGEQIALHLRNHKDILDVISINPCTDSNVLRLPIAIWLGVLLPLANLVNFLLGWGGYRPLISVIGEKYSLSLALSQLNAIAYSKDDEDYPEAWRLILSRHDEILDNKALNARYGFLPPPNVEFVSTSHANTIYQSGLYRDALDQLLVDVY